jgi:predicted ATP-dependent endonuclease of OLD family
MLKGYETMILKKVHIANFRCIRDSGIIDIEDFKTVLIGKNESGKTSFLKALEHFNMDSDFDPDDVCDFSKKQKDCACVITAWFQLSEKEQDLKGYFGETVKISKLLNPKIKENDVKVEEPDHLSIKSYLADLHWKDKYGYRYFQSFNDILGKLGHIKKIYRFEDWTGKTFESILLESALSIVSNLIETLNIEICKDKKRGRVKINKGIEYGFITAQSGEYVYADRSDIISDYIYEGYNLEENEEVIFDIAETDYTPRRPPYRLRTNLKAKNIFPIEYFFKKINNNIIERLKSSISSDHSNLNKILSNLRDDLYLYCLSGLERSFPNVVPHVERAIQAIARLEVIPYVVLRSIPQFVYIGELDEFKDTTDIKEFTNEPAKHSALSNLFKLVGIEVNILEEDNTPKSRALIGKKLSNALTNIIKPYWTQSEDLRIEIQVEEKVINIFVSDKLGNLIPFSKGSNGFQWYFSFVFNLEVQSKNNLSNNVILLDDPGLNLHPIAQKDMLSYLEYLSKNKCQVILATHSPFLIDPGMLSIIRTVIREKNLEFGTEVKKLSYDPDIDAFQPLRAAIGMTLAETLLISRYNLIVSGITDTIIHSLNRSLKLLDSRITIYPLSGDKKIPYFVHIFNKGGGSEFLVLLDADQSGRQTKRQLIKENKIDEERIIMLDTVIKKEGEVEFEDLFSDEFYNEMVNRVYEPKLGQKISLNDLNKEKKQTERYKDWFKSGLRKVEFQKKEVAEEIEKFVDAPNFNYEKLGKETLDNFTNLFKLINSKFKL